MSERTDEFLKRVTTPSPYGLCPVPTDAQEALDILIDYLIGEDEYLTTISMCTRQTNTIALEAILYDYSRRFRKEVKEIHKRQKREQELKDKLLREQQKSS